MRGRGAVSLRRERHSLGLGCRQTTVDPCNPPSNESLEDGSLILHWSAPGQDNARFFAASRVRSCTNTTDGGDITRERAESMDNANGNARDRQVVEVLAYDERPRYIIRDHDWLIRPWRFGVSVRLSLTVIRKSNPLASYIKLGTLRWG